MDRYMRNRVLYYWVPVVVWVAGIFVVSSLKGDSLPEKAAGISSEYVLHVTAFFVLFLLSYRLFRKRDAKAGIVIPVLYSLALTMGVAFSKECVQLLFPTRFFSLKDLLVDGGAAGLAVAVVGMGRMRESRE